MRANIASTRAVRPSPPPQPPLPILVPHEATDFFSWLRLSIYMCAVSLAIFLGYQLKMRPVPAERQIAMPLGLVFWAPSLRN